MASLTPDQWRLFVQIADQGSLTRTASARNVAQAAISKQLAAIERRCGGRLFDRNGRGVALSEMGRRLYPRVLQWLEDGDQMVKDVQLFRSQPSGVVRLGMLPTADPRFVRRIYERTRAEFPEILLRVVDGTTGKLNEWLETGQLDLAILSRYAKVTKRGETALSKTDRVVLVGPPRSPLLRRKSVAFEALKDLPLVLPCSPSPFRHILDHWARRKGFTLTVLLEYDSVLIQHHLAADTGLYTILASQVVAADVRSGRVGAAPLVSPIMNRTVTLCTSAVVQPTLASRAAAQILKDCAAEFGDL